MFLLLRLFFGVRLTHTIERRIAGQLLQRAENFTGKSAAP